MVLNLRFMWLLYDPCSDRRAVLNCHSSMTLLGGSRRQPASHRIVISVTMGTARRAGAKKESVGRDYFPFLRSLTISWRAGCDEGHGLGLQVREGETQYRARANSQLC